MIYGNPKQRLDSFSIDRKGNAKLSMSKPWSPSRPGMTVLELIAERPSALAIENYGVVGQDLKLENGVLRSSWEYEGLSIDGAANPLAAECNFDPEWGERSLLLNPNWKDLMLKYGGYVDQGTGRIVWPEWMPSAGYNSSSKASFNTWIRSPMFGRQTYLDLTGGTWIVPYMTRGPIESIFNRVGDIFKQSEVPGGAPKWPDRNYLKAAPKFKKRTYDAQYKGILYYVEEYYKLSDVGGWMKDIQAGWKQQIQA